VALWKSLVVPGYIGIKNPARDFMFVAQGFACPKGRRSGNPGGKRNPPTHPKKPRQGFYILGNTANTLEEHPVWV